MKESAPRILVVEDNAAQRAMLRHIIEHKFNYTVQEAAHGGEALQFLSSSTHKNIVAIILDLEMPEMNGRTTLPKLRADYPHIPVVVLTGTEAARDVVEMMKLGAADFLLKPLDTSQLAQSLEKIMRVKELEEEVARLSRAQEGKAAFADIVGREGLKAPLKLAQRAAQSDITVLLTGESGAGKEVFARAIHGESARKDGPFVAVNCGALPKELIESILFGHKKGAFTGAVADALGKFREAEGGTLFLDEIGEMPLDAQVKLLRALQRKEIEPVGLGRAIPVQVRIIAATNKNPLAEVKRGRMREDLYYRLNVFPIPLPPLRGRKADIESLAYHFLKRIAFQEKTQFKTLDSAVMQWLRNHDWPGNIRELENTITRAALLAEGDRVTMHEVMANDETAGDIAVVSGGGDDAIPPPFIKLQHPDGRFKHEEEIRQEAMRHMLTLHDNNIPRAAEALGMSKSTFYRIYKK